METEKRNRGPAATDIGSAGRDAATNVLRLRKAHGLTVKGLAERLAAKGRPIPASGLTRIELGQRRIDVDDLVALASVFDVTPGQLLLPPSELVIKIHVGNGGGTR